MNRLKFPSDDGVTMINQLCHVYTATEWDGTPQETEEMSPQWFSHQEIPYSLMWSDDIHWLPTVLAGKKIKATILFTSDLSVASYKAVEVTAL